MAIEQLKNHSVWIMDRGGLMRIQEIVDISALEWGRLRDDISSAQVDIAVPPDSNQREFLATLKTALGRYELCIWRGNARVWEGPLTLGTFRRDSVTLNALDVMHYADRTTMRAGYSNAYPNIDYVTNRAYIILSTELARKEALDPAINVVSHIVNHHEDTDAETSAVTLPYQSSVFEHVDGLASNSGMDYTVVGRAIHLWDTSQPAMGYTPQVTEADFLGEMYVSVYAMELGTISSVTDGQGNHGDAGEDDPYYGEVERLETAYDEQATTAPTPAELQSQAERNLSGRNPTPLQVRVPDNSSVNMEGVLTIEMLVPGVYLPVLAQLNVIPVSQMQKLNSVQVKETPNGETVQIVLYPASQSDVVEDES